MTKYFLIIILVFSLNGYVSAQTEDTTAVTNYKFLLVREDGANISVQTGKTNGIKQAELLKVEKLRFPTLIYSNIKFSINTGAESSLESADGIFTGEIKTYFDQVERFETITISNIKAWNDPKKVVDFPNIIIRIL